MSSTLGMPSATPSNATGRSGVATDQMGHIGKGILGTIEEGVGGTSSRQMYYGTGSAFYQAPSTQRSYGDDIRSFNVKTFGSRGMVNLPRRWLDRGPTEIFMRYPIKYAWAGPEYTLRVVPKKMLQNTLNITAAHVTAATGVPTGYGTNYGFYDCVLGECATEVRGCCNILPTYFWSGGVGFAFFNMIELNMGGGGNIIFDRYTNFAMIMASCPTIQMRRDLMKYAGGGLFYDYDTDHASLPVKFGWVPALTDEGTAINRNAANSAASDDGDNLNFIWAPIEWAISVPIKTPQTNFWNALLARKPLDTSCVASDIQYIITLGNFFEFTDTGTGLAHCPYYIPPLGVAVSPAVVAADVVLAQPVYHPCQANKSSVSSIAGGAGTYTYTNNTADRWFVYTAPSGSPLGSTPGTGPAIIGTTPTAPTSMLSAYLEPCRLPPSYFYTGFSPYLDLNWGAILTGISNPPLIGTSFAYAIANTSATPAAAETIASYVPRSRIGANPRIWANHYRVCNGFLYGGYGAPRPRMANTSGTAQTDVRYKLDAASVHSGSPLAISYDQALSLMEVRNHSLKFTNPALSARLPLQTTPEACLYYPFQYGFSQTYRIAPASNPFDASNFHRWNSAMSLVTSTSMTGQTLQNVFYDVTQAANKITQNIIMPANPCTSMIVGIYREKDRRYLGMNTQGSYSPALFWNALAPAKCTLYDGGNILFDYQSKTAYEWGSLYDRPDVFRIPFRGGLCQLDPKQIYGGPTDAVAGVTLGDSYPNGLNRLGGVLSRWAGPGGIAGDKSFLPIHLTEWYNAHLLEFPFCMHEPLGREGTVQSTPSFAKTILRLEFYLDPLLKAPRGLDDMYDQTTIPPSYWFSGEWDYSQASGKSYSTGGTNTGNVLPYGPLNFNNTTVATANVALSVPCAYILDSVTSPGSYADAREQVVQSTRSSNKTTNPYFTMSPSATSWNVNDGGLMIAVHFLQNQVWTISPLRTSILSARG